MLESQHLPNGRLPSRLTSLVMFPLRWYVSVPLFLILVTVGVICGYRNYKLSLLPPVVQPPEVVKLLAQPPVPDNENAHFDITEAAAQLSEFNGESREFRDVVDSGWDQASPHVRQYLSDNAAALNLFLAGTTKSDYLQLPVNDLDIATSLPDLGLARDFLRLAQLDVAHRMWKSDYTGAANVLQKLLRFSALISRNGSDINHSIGGVLQDCALELVARLLRDEECPISTITELKKELACVRKAIPRASQYLTVEYLTWQQTHREVVTGCWSQGSWDGRDLTQFELFFRAEPEFTYRVHQHYLAMLIADADVPRRDRTPEMNDPFLRSSAITKYGVSGTELRHAAEQIMSGCWLFDMQRFLDSYDRRLAYLDLTIIATALRQHCDKHGQFPADLQALCPRFLDEVPINPRSDTGECFLYRKTDAGCVVFSAGKDGIDQSYLIKRKQFRAEWDSERADDFGIRFGSATANEL